MAQTIQTPPVTRGIDTLSSDTAMPAGTVREADNVDLSREGEIYSRAGARLVASGQRLHSLHSSQYGLLVVSDNTLCQVDGNDLVPLHDLQSNSKVSYASLPTGLVLSNGHGIWQYDGDSVVPLPVQRPPPPKISDTIRGGGLRLQNME